MKQNLDKEMDSKCFQDAKSRILSLAKKSGLRKLNARAIAQDIRKKLKQTEFTYEDFKNLLKPHLLKVDPSTVAQQCNEATLKEIF